MSATSEHRTRELDSRESHGIEVQLLWDARVDSVSVAVLDNKTGDRFTLEVMDRTRALDVFRHPYAYAGCDARSGVALVAEPVKPFA